VSLSDAAAPLVFLGSNDVAARCLEVLAARLPVGLVITPPARRRGRGKPPTPTPVGAAAAALSLEVLETADVNAPEELARLQALGPSLLVVVAFGQILRKAVRGSARHGGINLHFSLLPRWRGAAPVQRALLAGDEQTGVAVQRLHRRLDAGALLALVREPIGPEDDSPRLLARLTEIGAPLLADVAERIVRDNPPPETEQDEDAVTQAPRIEKSEGRLDFATESAAQICRRVRAFGDWPGCRFELPNLSGERTIVRVRRAVESEESAGSGEPGTVLSADGAGVVIAAHTGAVCIAELQRAGARALPAGDFLNGWPVASGARVSLPSD